MTFFDFIVMSFTTLPFNFILEFDDFEDIFEGDVVGEEFLTSFAVGLCFKCGFTQRTDKLNWSK